MSRDDPAASARGLLSAAGAYAMWGLLPLYWRAIVGASAIEVLAHRIVWSLVFLLLVMARRGELAQLRVLIGARKQLRVFFASAILLTYNWGIFIWAVQSGEIVECSFGYFISPLFTVFLGAVVLRERLRLAQTAALLLALIGVAQIGLTFSQIPWIALTLAGSFSVYTLLRRAIPAETVPSLAMESLLMLPIALGILWFSAERGDETFFHHTPLTIALLLGAGAATACPLLLFTRAAKQLPFATLGMIQYLSPSMQLVMGVTVFHETLEAPRLRAFLLVWAAIVIFTCEAWWRYRVLTRERASGDGA